MLLGVALLFRSLALSRSLSLALSLSLSLSLTHTHASYISLTPHTYYKHPATSYARSLPPKTLNKLKYPKFSESIIYPSIKANQRKLVSTTHLSESLDVSKLGPSPPNRHLTLATYLHIAQTTKRAVIHSRTCRAACARSGSGGQADSRKASATD